MLEDGLESKFPKDALQVGASIEGVPGSLRGPAGRVVQKTPGLVCRLALSAFRYGKGKACEVDPVEVGFIGGSGWIGLVYLGGVRFCRNELV